MQIAYADEKSYEVVVNGGNINAPITIKVVFENPYDVDEKVSSTHVMGVIITYLVLLGMGQMLVAVVFNCVVVVEHCDHNLEVDVLEHESVGNPILNVDDDVVHIDHVIVYYYRDWDDH